MLRIDKKLLQYMSDIAVKTYPYECCGFLIGVKTHFGREVQDVLTCENISEQDKKRSYRIDPKEYIKVEKYVAGKGIEIVGVFHSHPEHPAMPSKLDLEYAMPNVAYLILSVYKNNVRNVRSWILSTEIDEFVEGELNII